MNTPLTVPCDCQHCRDILQRIADAGYIKQSESERSGGPMVSTVDKVLDKVGRPFGLATVFGDMKQECPSVMKLVDAAIRRAAEKAEEDIRNTNWAGSNGDFRINRKRDIIERHMRQELGL